MKNILKIIFYGVLIRPVLLIVLGFNARHIERLEFKGAHLIAANHNSHLDTMVLMSLFKLRHLPKIKVVAAKEYFCRTRLLAWFSIHVIGIIPLDRSGKMDNPLNPIVEALDEGFTVIIFPEGSRGMPEQQLRLRYGISKVLEERPDIETTPVYLYGLGKALPRGEGLLVPFICDLNVGEPICWDGDRKEYIQKLQDMFDMLKSELEIRSWQ